MTAYPSIMGPRKDLLEQIKKLNHSASTPQLPVNNYHDNNNHSSSTNSIFPRSVSNGSTYIPMALYSICIGSIIRFQIADDGIIIIIIIIYYS